ASKGIGRGIAAELVAEGARVAISSHSRERVEATAAELGAAAYVHDTADLDHAAGLVGEVERALGPIDVLVCNPGGPPGGPGPRELRDGRDGRGRRRAAALGVLSRRGERRSTPRESRTPAASVKGWCANHYTMGAGPRQSRSQVPSDLVANIRSCKGRTRSG